MAEQDESSMIGYDPLAWLHEPEAEGGQANPAPEHGSATDWTVAGDGSVDAVESVDSTLSTVELTEAVAELDSPTCRDAVVASTPDAELQSAVDEGVAVATVCQIILEPVQNIQTVGHLHRQLQGMLDTCNKIDIDASAVSQIDTASLQLLLVLKLTAVKQQKEVSIDFPSEKFIEASDLLGLSEMLSVNQSASGFF